MFFDVVVCVAKFTLVITLNVPEYPFALFICKFPLGCKFKFDPGDKNKVPVGLNVMGLLAPKVEIINPAAYAM
jgi:hypothetical protein